MLRPWNLMAQTQHPYVASLVVYCGAGALLGLCLQDGGRSLLPIGTCL